MATAIKFEIEEMCKKIDSLSNKVSYNSNKYPFKDLENAYSKYIANHVPEPPIENRIKYYEEVLNILKQYNVDDKDSVTIALFQDPLINLGRDHCNLGQKYFECNNSECAIENYCKSINYLRQIGPDCLNFMKEYTIYQILATCYEEYGIIRRDLESLQNALSYYEKVTELINTRLHHMKNTSWKTTEYEEIETLKEQKRINENFKQKCRQAQASIALSCDMRIVRKIPTVQTKNIIKKHKNHTTLCCLI